MVSTTLPPPPNFVKVEQHCRELFPNRPGAERCALTIDQDDFHRVLLISVWDGHHGGNAKINVASWSAGETPHKLDEAIRLAEELRRGL